MSTVKSKLANFWYYYKNHTIVALMIIVCVSIILSSQLKTVKPDFTLALVGNKYMLDEDAERLQNELAKYIDDLNGDGQKVVFLSRLSVSADPSDRIDMSGSQEMVTKIGLEFTHGDTRLFLMDEEYKEAYGNEDYLQPLNDYISDSKDEPIYTVSVENNKFLQGYNVDTKGLYIGIKLIPEREQNDEDVLKKDACAKTLLQEILKYNIDENAVLN